MIISFCSIVDAHTNRIRIGAVKHTNYLILVFLIDRTSNVKRSKEEWTWRRRNRWCEIFMDLFVPPWVFTNYLKSSVETHPKDRFGQSVVGLCNLLVRSNSASVTITIIEISLNTSNEKLTFQFPYSKHCSNICNIPIILQKSYNVTAMICAAWAWYLLNDHPIKSIILRYSYFLLYLVKIHKSKIELYNAIVRFDSIE